MLNNDLSGLTDEEYKELKQYLKDTYDFDSFSLKPLVFSKNLIIRL